MCWGDGEESGSGPQEPDLWLRLARRARASAGFDSPVDPFAYAGSVCGCLVHRAHAIAAMTAGARPWSRREKAEQRLPAAAADLTLARRATAPRHRWWSPPRLPLRRVPFRRCSPPRGHVALEAATGLGGETGAEHALRLGAQELRPAGADPTRRRAEARDAQHGCDHGRRDVDSELQQLALDAHIAPARVLPRQPEDQPARLGRKRRTTRPAAAPSAIALQQRPVPAAQRLRTDRKARPPLGRKQPARRSKQRTVSGPVLRPPPSAPQDRELVAQNHDLKLALTPTASKQTNETAEEPVQQTDQQDAQSEPLRP